MIRKIVWTAVALTCVTTAFAQDITWTGAKTVDRPVRIKNGTLTVAPGTLARVSVEPGDVVFFSELETQGTGWRLAESARRLGISRHPAGHGT